MLFDIFQNAIVRCRFAALVMLRSETVDRDNDLHFFQSLPLPRDFADSAGHDVRANSPFAEFWQDFIQFPKSNERLTAHD